MKSSRFSSLRRTLYRAGSEVHQRSGPSNSAPAGIRSMRQASWTVDAGPSNVASRSEPGGRTWTGPGRNHRHGRASARTTETDTGNPAFLGWHAGGRAAPAALRRLRQRLFPAAPVLPGLCLTQGQHIQGQRQGEALQLRDPSSPGARLYGALRHRRGGTGRRSAHDEQHCRLSADAGGARTRHEAGSRVRKARRQDHPSLVPPSEGLNIMRRNQVAVVGAAETTELGVIPNVSQIQLHADAALNAIADAGLKLSDIDGFATAVETPQQIAHYLGITPTWVDGTSVGGCSFMLHVRHAAAAIEAGLCKTVLITHAESGKSNIGRIPRMIGPDSLNGQFELPYGVSTPASMFPIPVLRYMKTHGITHEQIAMVAVVQREWAARNPRATMKAPITVEDVLNSRMIAYPFRILQCCLVTDGGGALILTSADRAKDFPKKPVYILGTGESVETPMVSQMQSFDSSRAFRVAGPLAFKEAGITHKDVDHLMIYDAFAHLPLYGLGDLGFIPDEEAGQFIADGNTRPGGKLPLNTNGGGLSYMHSGMYGMYALQESVRQMRGIAPAQVPGAKISVCHGVGGMFAASGTIIFTNER